MAVDPVVGFCLWRNKNLYSPDEVSAHNSDDMKACPVHEGPANRPGG